MAGIGMESPDKKELDERALPAEPSDNSSRPHRERRKPDRYGSLAPEGSISSKPKSLPHHSQAADPSPTMTGAALALGVGIDKFLSISMALSILPIDPIPYQFSC